MTSTQSRAWSVAAIRPLDAAATLLSLAVVACLAIDAYVHLSYASDYDAVKTSVLSQGELFRAEGVAAAVVAVALLVRRRRYTWAAAGAVLAGGFAAVVLYTYVDVGTIGPIPDMYQPTWVLRGKTTSAWAEAIGAVLAIAGLLIAHRRQVVARRQAAAPDARLSY